MEKAESKTNTTTEPTAEPKRGGFGWLRKILLVLAAIVVILVIAIARQPNEFQVTRAAAIAAPPASVFAQVNDFHAWQTWSPWAKLDPAAKNSFEGAKSGKGAIFKWSGNDQIGEGMMTILESRPDELIKIKLDFIRPFASSCTVEFTFQPEGQQTVTTWRMWGSNSLMGKVMCMFMNMDKMVGGDFEKGLASMKQIAEAKKK